MTGFMDGDQSPLFVADHNAGANAAEQDLVSRSLDVATPDARIVVLHCDDSCLVEEVGQLGTRMSYRELGQPLQIHVVAQW